MSILSIVIGVMIAINGFFTITKKWMWLQQGIMNRPVHVAQYMRYMGSIDIIFGLLWTIIGIIYYRTNNSGFIIISGLIYFSLKVFGEFEFRNKQTN